MRRPSFTELHAFIAIATHGSFRRAADVLGAAPSSLSHMMRTLEEKTDARLLHRTTRSVSLTEAGHHFLKRIQPLIDDLDLAIDEVGTRGDQVNGTLQLNVLSNVGLQLLDDVMPAFLAHQPGIAVDMHSEGRLVDIVAEGFDAGIRLGLAVPQDMHAVPFGPPIRFLPVASPSYFADRPLPDTPTDLQRHSCIRHRVPSGKRYRWDFLIDGRPVGCDVPGRLTLNDPATILRAALQGLGIAYVNEQDARPHLADGTLIALLKPFCPEEPGLHVYYPGRRHVPPPLRAFLDFIKQPVNQPAAPSKTRT